MNSERNFDLTIGVVGLSGIAGGKYMLDGLTHTARSGGFDKVLQTSVELLKQVHRLDITQVLAIASLHPHEMQALLSFTIAAACGLVAVGAALQHAHHEANQ